MSYTGSNGQRLSDTRAQRNTQHIALLYSGFKQGEERETLTRGKPNWETPELCKEKYLSQGG